MLRRVKSFLWIASVPLALTYVFAQPARAADPHAAEAAEGGHHFITNPIQNGWNFSYKGKDDHGGTLEKGEHAMPAPFVGNVFNFLVYAFLMFRVAGPSVKRVVRERHDEIAKNLAESGRLRDEARARLDEYNRKLGGLESEITSLVTNIRAEAEAEKRRIIADGEARADRMRRDADQQIQAEIQRVKTTLEREAVVAAVSIAEQILRDKTGDADQRALADKFVKGLGDAAARRRPRA